MSEALTGMMACFACGTVTRPALYIAAGPVCATCEAERMERAVAQRCAPLVEALQDVQEAAANHTDPHVQEFVYHRATQGLAAYHAAQGAGRGT